ncbi:hypothetical protein A3H03_02010 [Candidatus Kuenenbacteria bacterium RIFCSPLOWO2_12_FULL_42_13]|uniref:Uncharacterized protein n=5 Tax=Candidatus Kueneniibacteriota TaxID=1752740 RepID=A0A0G0Z2S7_9BACT|nr:MAG: hypothetical protein UV02_C0004G0011 [Candidatus Kuenenbacteria bacterium GW2011_GWA2_42_15]OGG90729.1 MAG: hypothetical protein A3H55_00910 [Candidatus Kuenenbacteria bacterium RIFCSPLOWO2_02_FULL_42_16]OGG91748.1 MAG: hypothetical protein A3H03_02010 [Candidatus Kuenenbacteria bacterium RIFCSPLOWO2_12_FULL_42_13]OGG96002.1 MAG: hypothetical protein A2V95_01080 [Candidatus Kuenenbacteria bacterium RBG_16_41_7]OGG98750.1 MAG: hypothetical protein A3E04_00920 [Candidatus Kuenenbacteria b
MPAFLEDIFERYSIIWETFKPAVYFYLNANWLIKIVFIIVIICAAVLIIKLIKKGKIIHTEHLTESLKYDKKAKSFGIYSDKNDHVDAEVSLIEEIINFVAEGREKNKSCLRIIIEALFIIFKKILWVIIPICALFTYLYLIIEIVNFVMKER